MWPQDLFDVLRRPQVELVPEELRLLRLAGRLLLFGAKNHISN